MKKITLILLFVSAVTFAQKSENTSGKNRSEIKLNAFSLALGAIDFEFERTINKKSSIGFSILTNLDEFIDGVSIKTETSLSVFYRRYFGKKYASGFFVEGFGMYNRTPGTSVVSFGQLQFSSPDHIHDFGKGAGIGYKWVSKNGLVLQSNFALGRNFFNASRGEEYIGRLGVSIGWSF